MIFSRHVARRRVAAGVRPGWLAAWGPVALDTLALVAVLALLVRLAGAMVLTWPVWAAVVTLVCVVFLPVQIVLITSAFWASQSRWADGDTDRHKN